MSVIEVRAKKLKSYAEDERKIKKNLASLQREITACQNSLGKVLSVSEDHVQQNLKTLNQSLGKEIKAIDQMATVLDSISNIYISTEKDIEGTKITIKNPGQAGDAGKNEIIDLFLDIRHEMADGLGNVGVIRNVIDDGLRGNFTLEKGFKYILKATKASAKQVQDGDWVKAWFGISVDESKGGWDYIKDELKEYTFDSSKTGIKATANKIGTAAAWASLILTGVTKFNENKEEFKDQGGMENPRFWKETALETTVAIAGPELIKAGLVGVVGMASWPAAVATGVAVVVGDAFSEHYLEKDLTEVISDGLINVDEKYGFSDRIIDEMEFNSTVKSIGNVKIKTADDIMSMWAKAGI